MRSPSGFSAQTLSVLAALCGEPSQWRHGYALAQQTGLKSGTLYPILIRLADRGLVEACWQDEPVPGRPRRHLYRLTADGAATATQALAAAERRASPASPRRQGLRVRGARGVAAPGASCSRLGRAVSRWVVRLVPDGRRDWAEALWAEADQAPPGLARLAWRAGGVRFIVREARVVRLAARALVFAAAAAWIVHVAWPGPAANPATAVNRLNVVTLLPVLAGLPVLARWLFGPAAPGLPGRALRYGAYASVLVLTLAKASVEPVADNPAATPLLGSDASTPVKDGMIFTWLTESLFLLLVAVYVTAILVLTARRTRVTPATLVIGTGAGLMLGAVLYAIFPLGFAKQSTNPRLSGYVTGLLVGLAWVLLFAGPALASAVAARRYRGPDSQERVGNLRIRQAAAAGFLATAIGALTVTALGTATVALLPRAAWLRYGLYPGQHPSAAAAYYRELTASVSIGNYGLMLLFFPVIGLLIGLWAGAAPDRGLAAGNESHAS